MYSLWGGRVCFLLVHMLPLGKEMTVWSIAHTDFGLLECMWLAN